MFKSQKKQHERDDYYTWGKILSINPSEVSETPTGLTFNTFSTAMKPEPRRLTLGDPVPWRHLGVAPLLDSPETLSYQS